MKRLPLVFKNYDEKMTGLIEGYNEAKEEARKTFSSTVYTEKIGELNAIFLEESETAKKEALNAIDSIFKEVKASVDAYVAAPIAEDFNANFEAIRAMGESVSKAEATAFLNKYRDNYIAARSITNYFHETMGYFTPLKKYDEINTMLEAEKDFAKKVVREYQKNGYYIRLVTWENKENYWYKIDSVISAFINGETPVAMA